MRDILLNFLEFEDQDFGVTKFRRKAEPEVFREEFSYYDFNDTGENIKYEVSDVPADGFTLFKLPSYINSGLVSKTIYQNIINASANISERFILKEENYNRRIHFKIESHPKGKKSVWIEPYYLKSKQVWGVLIGFQFIINEELNRGGFKQDRDIQIASGSLNNRGLSNLDFYLFKYNHITGFIKNFLPKINEKLEVKINSSLFSIEAHLLNPKQYIFKDNKQDNSSYYGLSKFSPLETIPADTQFYFIYKKEDRNIAVNLLKGLRGESHPNTFSGIEKFFKIPFTNDHIKGLAFDDYGAETIAGIIEQIKAESSNVLPIIITNSKKDESDDKLYFNLKHSFTNAGIPCQVVTKDLIINDNALKFSLGNIALQMFAKAGGKPWKMKPATNEYLIIGIGQSYNVESTPEGNKIEKNIAYSVLTDSSGIFKDLQVLSEGVLTDDSYYSQLTNNLVAIINKGKYKKISIHTPMRLSKEKILDRVVKLIDPNIELSVLVINDKTDYFGFDASNNGLVPFESTFVKFSAQEYLIWFEGIQPSNPKITKRYGNPLHIQFWFTNKKQLFEDIDYKEALLQDCINLSGANWRGFKAKQLPVSVFYCQRISEFIGKFRKYELSHIDINNLKPWFL
ncbi:Piwi domain-containing protein [Adhaeribacter aquaticus]|uniref:Piwi domain-containing protein n=1 Tax=Adhaeribacter aquaticus TaxID=299567 RepID=UPI00047CECDF|nr:Piwi domain-containing protein [Adhaeribacter aquaticus]